ncbi:MAG: helix-turn-helix domain-containing protein [Spirochaetota bacterium]
MNISSSLTLITVFCAPLVAMIAYAWVRLPERRTRWLFVAMASALMVWAVPLVLVRADFLDAASIATASRLTFLGGVLGVLGLYLFFEHFAGFARGRVRYAILINSVVLLAATSLGYVEQGVQPSPVHLMPVRGPLHRYYVLSLVVTIIYSFFMIAVAYRKSESALLRFQLRSIGGYGFLGFLFPILNNGLMPILVENYPYPAFGVIGVLLFQFGIFNMLVRGQWLFIRNIFGRLHQSLAWNQRENIVSLSRLVELLNSIVAGNVRNFREAFAFVSERGEARQLFAQSDTEPSAYSTPAKFQKEILPKWNQGIVDNLVRLEADNKRLALYLTKAETLVHDKWLNAAAKSLSRPYTLELPQLPLNLYAAEHTKSVHEYHELFGQELLVCSTELFTVIENLKRLKNSQLPVVFEGESGVGKTTLARALHYLRLQRAPLSLECTYQTRHIVGRLQRLSQQAQAQGLGGVVLRNIDAMRPEELVVLFSFVMGAAQLPLLYLTVRSLEGLAAKLGESAQRAYADALPQLKISPLASRPDDLRGQLFYFSERLCRERSMPYTGVAKDLLDRALQYSWPGNTNELKVRVEQSLLLQPSGTMLEAKFLNLRETPRAVEGPRLSALEKAERDVIWECLQRRRFNQRQTSIELEITINTLRAKMEKYGLQIPEEN